VPCCTELPIRREAAIADLTQVCIKEGIQPNELEHGLIKKAVHDNTDHRLFVEVPNILEWVVRWSEHYRLSKHMVGHEERMAIDLLYHEVDWSEADFRGIVDVIDIKGAHCTITDYKSQPHILSQTDLDAHYQLTFYAWLVSKFYPFVKTFEVRIWYLRYGFYAKTPRTKEQLKGFEDGLLLKVDKVMSIKDWNPIPGAYCKWCDHAGRCPVGKPDENGCFSPLPQAIINEEQAKHYGSELRVIERRRGDLSKALKEYIKGHEEPVKISDSFAFGYRQKTSVFYPPAKVLAVMKEHGVDAAGYVTFSTATMKKLLKSAKKDQPALYNDLEDASESKARTMFEGFEVR